VTTGTCSTLCFGCYAAFSVLTLLVEQQEGHLACKKTELVSMNIYNVQLSRMSHCAQVARKPICLEFTPEAAVGDILVA